VLDPSVACSLLSLGRKGSPDKHNFYKEKNAQESSGVDSARSIFILKRNTNGLQLTLLCNLRHIPTAGFKKADFINALDVANQKEQEMKVQNDV
jgi:hypothetical protein